MDFTVIVPTFNRPQAIAGCLESLARLDYPRDAYEVIVVDDGGAGDLRDAVDRSGSMTVTMMRQENGGPAAARNNGAREAKGRWLAFTDDDCRPQAGWLGGLRAELEQGEEVLAGGRTTNQLSHNVYSAASHVVVEAAYRFYNRDRDRGRFLASNNMGVWRERLLAAGGFDERFRPASEDRELCDRWTWRGGRIVWTDAAVVDHCHDLTFRGFLSQHYRYGRGAALLHRTRAARGTGSLWDDNSFRWHWIDLLLSPAMASERPLATLALLACWQAANTAGFAREVISGLWRRH